MAEGKQKVIGRDSTSLSARLEEYSAFVRVSAATLRARTGNWPIYAAAVGSALAMGTNASASIIYYGQSDNYNNTSNAPQVPIPAVTAASGTQRGAFFLDAAGHVAHLFASAGGTFGLVDLVGVGKVNIFVSSYPNSGFAKRFLPGSLISSKAGSARATGEIARFASAGGTLGNFPASHTGFAGLAIASGATNGGTEYGWIRLEVFNGQNGYPDKIEAIDWAVNNSGGPIEAGQTPEPGTLALSLLAAGAAGIAALRRRRKA